MKTHPLTLVHVTTIAETLNFLQGQIGFMMRRGFFVHAVASPSPMLEKIRHREGIAVHPVAMERRISPLADLVALLTLFRLFLKIRPSIVHAHTPKGGLLGVLAARMTLVPGVVYTMHGLRFVTEKGRKKDLLRRAEAMTCYLAHQVLAVSHANLQRALDEKLCPGDKIRILANGSCNGVDALGRFNPEYLGMSARKEVRRRNGIPESSLVLGYVGRIVRDKGIVELAQAWHSLRDRTPDAYLLLVGPLESHDPVPQEILAGLKNDPRVVFAGWTDNPAPFYMAMDMLILPSYREGFPISPLEASAMGIPVVATCVDGTVEAVEDGVTGILVPPRDTAALVQAIQTLIERSDLRQKMGLAGRRRVLALFQPEPIWQETYELYMNLLRR